MFLSFFKEKVRLDSLAKSLLLSQLSQGFGWFDVSRFDDKRILTPAEKEVLRASLADFFVVLVLFLLLDRLVITGPKIGSRTLNTEFCRGAVSAYMESGLSTDQAKAKVEQVLGEQGYLDAVTNQPEPPALPSSIPEAARAEAMEVLNPYRGLTDKQRQELSPFYFLCDHFAKRTVKLLSGDKGFDAPRTMIALECAHNLYRSTQAGVMTLLKKVSVTLPPYQS